MSRVEFEVLGPVRLRGTDGMVEPAGLLQRILLGVLLARANEPVPVDVLADALWRGEVVARATQKVQFHVHKLRRILDDRDRLSFEPSGYRLRVRPGELDVERFTTLVGTATTDPAHRAELLREALGLWRGTPYEGLDVPLLADEAGRLAERRLTALELRYEAELDLGQHAAAIPGLSALAAAHPLRERLVGLLMTALHQDGRQAEALEVYRATRRRLVDELGLEPGPGLRAVEQQVLSGAYQDIPAHLPHNVRGFVGRDAELSELDSWLDGARDAPVTAVVVGTAGVGKTALAVRWAHRVRDRFPDGQLYVDLRGYGPDDPVPPEDALAGFLRALGVDGTGVPQELDERSARFRSLVDGKKMLVLLDNARTVDQVRPLLAGTPTVVVLVTSRDMLAGLVVRDGAERLVMDRLPVDESVTLLRSLADGRLDSGVGEAVTLAGLCARLPLALRIAAELVRARPGSSIAELITELTDENRRLDLFGLDGDPHTAVRAAFAWSYQHLPQPAARLFRFLGVHPGQDIDTLALAALAGDTLRTTTRALDALARAHLVDEVSHGRYQPHDLLRVYLMGRPRPAPALTNLGATLRFVGDPDRAIDLVRQGIAAAETAGDRASLTYGTHHLAVLYEYTGAFGPALELSERALRMAGELGMHVLAAEVVNHLGNVHRGLGDLDAALRCHRDALTNARVNQNDDLAAQASNGIGETTLAAGDAEAALRHHRDALTSASVCDSPFERARAHAGVGDSCARLGNLAEARTHWTRARAIYADLGTPEEAGMTARLAGVVTGSALFSGTSAAARGGDPRRAPSR